MTLADFVHLRVHSAYSLAEGAIKTKDLIRLCQTHAMPAVAVTDTNNVFGALEFALAAQAGGIQPIVGTVLLVARPEIEDGTGPIGRSGSRPEPDQLVILAQDDRGYENLMALLSRAYMQTPTGETPHVCWASLAERHAGLIALTGGPKGAVGRLLAEGQTAAGEACFDRLKRIYPGRLYVELHRHGLAVEERIEPDLIDLAYSHDVPLVATNDVYFADEAMYAAHDALLCIADGAYVGQDDRRRETPDHRFLSAAEMRARFADVPEAIDNTLVIPQRCHTMPRKRKPILPAFDTGEGRDEAAELRHQAHEGLDRRLLAHVYTPEMTSAARDETARRYRERLDYELDIIERMGFPGYFLIVADFIKWAKAQAIPVGPGRGSGAGSVVAWSLTITDLDPLRFGLLFERFLNPERVSMPDFDIDFCQDRRDEVIAYVQDKYGHDRVAQIITFGKLQARAVMRDVGRVLQMPYGQVDRLCKLVPNNPANPVTLAQAIQDEPLLQQERDTDETVATQIDIALKLEGLYRHASTHAAGVVIGDRPLEQLVAIYRDPRSPMPVTQFNMKYVEQAGLVKFDFLGLKTLTVLQRAVELIAEHGVPVDLATIPLDDPKTFEFLGTGATTGVFQLESAGMRDTLRQLKPNRFEDIIALVALYRPGPMANIPTYIAVKAGKQDPDYLYPSLQPILEETYGIMIYQEQVMQVAQELAGYTLGQADLLRRAMGKKIKAEMDVQKSRFIDGATARGVEAGTASRIFDQVEKFAGYGFNKSHAAAYALVAYQTAFLKTNYPVEFLAASMTLDLGNTDKLNTFKQELDRLGIALLPPDVNRSGAAFTVERDEHPHGAIRYALGAIKGVGIEAMKGVVAARQAGRPFEDLFDFAQRVDPRSVNKRILENLVRAGAFDSLNGNRAQTFAAIETVLRFAQATADEQSSGQESLFGGAATPAPTPRLPEREDWERMERLSQEHEAIGFYLSAHPIDPKRTARLGCVTSAEIQPRALSGATLLKLAGIVMSKRETKTRTGKRMAFVALSDTSGGFEVTLFEEVLATCRDLLQPKVNLLIEADVQRRDGDVRLTAQRVSALDSAIESLGTCLQVTVDRPESVPAIRGVVDRFPPGRGEIRLLVAPSLEQEIEIDLGLQVRLSAEGRQAIKSLPGVVAIGEL